MPSQKVLVVGASGKVASEITRILKTQNIEIRTTTSKKEKTTQDNVYLNLSTSEGIDKAFEGMDCAFIFSPAGFADQYRILFPLIQESKKRKLKKVVLMSAMGADAVENSPLRRSEIELEKSGIQFNIIRPNWFMQNFNTFWIHGINTANKIFLPAGTARTSFIDARDISDVAAKLLINDEFSNQGFDLTGPEALNHDEVAKHISEVSGRKITYQEISPEEFKKSLLGAGLPEDYSDFLLMIMGALKEGYNASIFDSVKKILGRNPKTFKSYVEDFKQNWIL